MGRLERSGARRRVVAGLARMCHSPPPLPLSPREDDLQRRLRKPLDAWQAVAYFLQCRRSVINRPSAHDRHARVRPCQTARHLSPHIPAGAPGTRPELCFVPPGQSGRWGVGTFGHEPATRQLSVRAGEQPQDFTLIADVNLLEPVVVTGTQEATERVKVPFSVTRVDASQIPVPAEDPLRALQGKIPANIVSYSGRPGAQPSVLLRGPTSINAQGRGQDPLYIVDGVIINGALPDINPGDIESVEVVKGAAGASLYGARAGHGGINITTKSGRRALEGVQFSARSEGGVSDIERDFGLARFQALAMDEHGRQFCQAVSGQPLCARTFDYLKEEARINNYPADSATTTVSLPIDPGANIAGDVLRRRFQVSPWPSTGYNAVNQVVTPPPYFQNSVDVTGRFA